MLCKEFLFFKLLFVKIVFFLTVLFRYWRYNIFIRIHNTRKSHRTISINLHAIFLTLKILRKIRSLNLAWTHVYFISLFLSSHISDTKFFRSSGPVHSPLQFHSFIFIPFLRLTPVHVETQYGSATSQNSIENRVRQCIRVYSIRRDKVNKPEGTEKQKRILRSREPFAIQKILVYR